MKKLLLFLLIVFSLNSCITVKSPYKADVSMISYGDYIKKGFFITESNSVNFDYTPIGSVHVDVTSGYVQSEKDIEKAQRKSDFTDEYFAGDDKDPYYNHGSLYVESTYKDVLNLMYEKIIKEGGNGILNLKYRYSYDSVFGVGTIHLSGMAIKK